MSLAANSSPDASRKSAPKKVLVLVLSLLFILVLAVGAAMSIMISTNAGSRWIIDRALQVVNEGATQINYESIEGNLLWGVNARALQIETEAMTVNIGRLRSSWQPLTLLYGQLTFTTVRVETVQIDWHDSTSSNTGSTATLPSFPLKISASDIRVSEAKLTMDDQVYALDSAQLSANLEQNQLTLESFNFANSLGNIAGEANIALTSSPTFSGEVDWRYAAAILDRFDGANGHLDFEGTPQAIAITHELQQPFTINSVGSVTFGDSPSIDISHNYQSVNTNIEQWMGMDIDLSQMDMRTESDFTSLQLVGEARADITPPDSALSPQTVNVTWNARLDQNGASLTQLNLSTATGQFLATGDFQWSSNPELTLTVELTENMPKNYSAMIPDALEIEQVHALGRIAWRRSGESWTGSVALDNASAQLNGYPLIATGNFILTPDSIGVESAQISTADNLLALNGSWSDAIDMTWRLDANSLDNLSDSLAGTATGEGRISGTAAAPQLNMNATGRNITYANNSIGNVSLTAAYSNDNQITLALQDVRLESDSIPYLETLNLAITGELDEHSLSLQASSDLGDIDLDITGALTPTQDWRWVGQLQNVALETSVGPWRTYNAPSLEFTANHVSLASSCWQQHQIRLCGEATWNSASGLLANIFLQDFELSAFNSIENTATEFSQWLPHLTAGNRIEGQLVAQASISSSSEIRLDTLRVTASVDAGEGTLTLDTSAINDAVDLPNENEQIHWQHALLNAELNNGAWQLSASATLNQRDLVDTGLSIQGNFSAELSIGRDRNLNGSVQASLDDLAWTQAFIRDLDNPHGSLSSNLTIEGTLDAPTVNGVISIVDAGFEVPALGITIFDLDAALDSQNTEAFTLQGSAHSGAGILRFTSDVQLPFTPEWTINAELTGEQFELTKQDDIELRISPDVRITMADKFLDIRGTLLLPTANITLTELPESTVNVSSDAVIVTQNNKGDVRNAAQSDLRYLDGMRINSELRVELGDDAHFFGFGLDTKLEGALEISRSQNSPALTYGELRVVEGHYRIYGRTLEIEHGKLLFFGSLTNPALDIRAVRQTQDIKVGLQMNGTLRKIRSQLFSTPSLPDGDIIAVMLTDKPFAEIGNQDSNALLGAVATLGINQGKSLTNEIRSKLGLDTLAINSGGDPTNSSLTLGKYLTPSLFIRYGVGLFDTESVVSLDYTVSERVKIEAKSGNSQSVDLTYTVER